MANKLDELKSMLDKLVLSRMEERDEYVTAPEMSQPRVEERDEYVTAPEMSQPIVPDQEMAEDMANEVVENELAEAPNKIVERDNAPKEEPSDRPGLGGLHQFENEQSNKMREIAKIQDQIDQEEGNIEDNDEALAKAERTDEFAKLFNRLDRAAALYGAANPAAQIGGGKPVESIDLEADAAERLRQQRLAESKQNLDRLRALMNQKYKQEMLQQGEERLDLQKEAQQAREARKLEELEFKKQQEDRRLTKQEWRQQEKDELSDKQVESISGIDETLNMVDRIENLMGKVDTGPIAGRAKRLAKATIGDSATDQDFVSLDQITGMNLAEYIKGISGAAVSEAEAQRLMRNIPSVTDDDETFTTKLDNFKDILKEARETRLKNIEKQGKNPSKLMQRDPSTEYKKEKSMSGRYGEIVEKDGKTYRWNPKAGKYQLAR